LKSKPGKNAKRDCGLILMINHLKELIKLKAKFLGNLSVCNLVLSKALACVTFGTNRRESAISKESHRNEFTKIDV